MQFCPPKSDIFDNLTKPEEEYAKYKGKTSPTLCGH